MACIPSQMLAARSISLGVNANVWYLAAIQQPEGHWVAGMLRPPTGGADITATELAMRSLQLYPLSGGRRDEIRQSVSRAAEWLANATPRFPTSPSQIQHGASPPFSLAFSLLS